MTIGAPQVVFIGLSMLGVGIAMARYGQPKRDSYDISDCLIGPVITHGLLWWGGFYG